MAKCNQLTPLPFKGLIYKISICIHSSTTTIVNIFIRARHDIFNSMTYSWFTDVGHYHQWTQHIGFYKCQCNTELDRLCWSSQRRSPTPHFWEWAPRGLWPTNSNSAEIFVQCTFQVSSWYVYSFGSYRVDKQTDKETPLKTSNLFATLRRWAKHLRHTSCTQHK